ncbi:MAG: hypothetical protein KDD37_00840 [Bdellovibrionales bacterium]|nr:hypothetical protein [Bdellovibrionales bacterium]
MKLLLLLSILLTACTSITIQVPANRFISPEAQGDSFLRGRVTLGGHGGSEIEVVESKFSDSPTTDPEITEDSGAQIGIELNLIKSLDVYYIINYNSYDSLGLKYQILGDSVASAKAKSFSLAVGAGILTSTSASVITESDDTTSTEIETTIKFSGHEYFLLLGYRPSDNVLIYLGPWFTKFDTDVVVDKTDAGVTTRTVDMEGEGDQKNILLGLQFGTDAFHTNLEAAYTKINYKKTTAPESIAKEVEDFVWGAAFSYRW